LKSKSQPKLSTEDKKQLRKNISALVIYKLALVITSGTNNILISRFIGITAVGLYANYLLIITSLSGILSQVVNALIASVGNLSATENDERKYEVFKVIQFSNFYLYGFCSICLFTLLNPFITIWIGKQYLFSMFTVLPIVLGFYILGMQNAVSVFREAEGFFWQGKLRPLAQTIVNLVSSVVLVKLTGHISSVFWGTVIGRLTTLFWFDPYVVHKYGFHKPLSPYFLRYGMYTLVFLFSCTVTYCLAHIINISPIINLFLMTLICVIVPNAVFLACFYKTPEFKYVRTAARALIRKLKRKNMPAVQ
jgi:O-antigen/teichoic acid export membrane protein